MFAYVHGHILRLKICIYTYLRENTTLLHLEIGLPMRKMYWADLGTLEIQCVNLDGSDVEDLITTGLDRPSGIALCCF